MELSPVPEIRIRIAAPYAAEPRVPPQGASEWYTVRQALADSVGPEAVDQIHRIQYSINSNAVLQVSFVVRTPRERVLPLIMCS
jgi:hypothetical protein